MASNNLRIGLVILASFVLSASATSLRANTITAQEKPTNAGIKKNRLLGFWDDLTQFLPDFELPGREEIVDYGGETACDMGISPLCDDPKTGAGPACPQVSALDDTSFDANEYIAKSWYVQKQQVYPLLSKKQMNCVVHTYDMRKDGFLSAQHYANNKQVNGVVVNFEEYGELAEQCMEQVNGGSMKIGSCAAIAANGDMVGLDMSLFDMTAGPNWVLAVADDYSWAIVSGGPPDIERKTIKVKNKATKQTEEVTYCTTKEGNSVLDLNTGAGLWLMTREPVATGATIKGMEEVLTDMRIFTGDLKDVNQEGCRYYGADIKE